MSGLLVFLGGEPVGRVTEGGDRACWFSYLPEYTQQRNPVPLSLTAPVGTGRYDISEWMDNLLPNRFDVREHWMRVWGAGSLMAMDMLATPVGWDCAGAVQFCGEEAAAEMLARAPGADPLSEGGLARHLESIRRSVPGLPDAPGWVPFSLAGAQAKTALVRREGGWAVPTGGAPSTHILKTALPGFADNDLVEHVCMRALRLCGVAAARTEIVQAEGERAVAVERFDRRGDPGGPVARVHQEDVCQALGFPSHIKYQHAGGPSPVDLADLLGRAFDSRTSLALFRDALICNWLLAAPDAHAKNYSLLMDAGGYVLAPLYDVCSAAPYGLPVGEIAMAMTVGDAWTVAEADVAAAWIDCADDLGLDGAETLVRAEELCDAMPAALMTAVNDLPGGLIDSPVVAGLVEHLVGERLSRLPQRLAHSRHGDGFRARIEGSGPVRRPRRTRCPHHGKRTRRRCIRLFKHRGPHRYK